MLSNKCDIQQNNTLNFTVSDIIMGEEGIFINLVEKHEELSDKKTKKAEQKSILKNDYLFLAFCLRQFFQGCSYFCYALIININ